jgi:hypothetical protein
MIARAFAVLSGTVLFVALMGAVYAAAPWVLPVRIVEGPLLQQVSQSVATIGWYLTRPSECAVTLGNGRTIRSEGAGNRRSITFDGLTASTRYDYSIRAGGRELFRGAFRTARSPGESFRFVVFGDSGRGTLEQYALAANMRQAAPDFLLHTGDLVYGRGERHKYEERFFAPYLELISEVCFWPCLGNHDVGAPSLGTPYREVFELPENGPAALTPENNYWFDYGSARIAVVDSNLDAAALRDHVAPWLTNIFAAAPLARWRFVCFHHPPYTAGKYNPDVRIQRTIVPAIEAAGVDVVFNGHDHMYERTLPLRGGQIVAPGHGGVVYIVSGAGGAQLYDAAPQRPAYISALHSSVHSFTCVDVDGDTLKLRQIALGGEILDSIEITKPAAVSSPTSPNQ